MKRVTLVSLFVFTHIFFVFLQIHKHALFIKQSYRKQKNELLRQSLIKKKQDITHQLYALKNNETVKEFAQKHLEMVQLRVHQIKKLNNNDQ